MRVSAASRALRSSATANTSSPAFGTPDKPSTSAGIDGPASLIACPVSSNIARTRPNSWPASNMSPWCSVPSWTNTVATGPRPLSSADSTTTPRQRRSGEAFSSRTSACNTIESSSWSTPSPLIAETGTKISSPPHSSATTSSLASSARTRSGSASGLSILLTATIKGTFAARACWMASLVCGITPSSAATTSTTMSVAWAPRARIAVKAACPGVSKNVTVPLLVLTL